MKTNLYQIEKDLDAFTTAVHQPVTYYEWGQYPISSSGDEGEPEKKKKTAKKQKEATAEQLVLLL